MSTRLAAASERSMMRPSTNGPRSLILTSTDFPFVRFSTRTHVSKAKRPVGRRSTCSCRMSPCLPYVFRGRDRRSRKPRRRRRSARSRRAPGNRASWGPRRVGVGTGARTGTRGRLAQACVRTIRMPLQQVVSSHLYLPWANRSTQHFDLRSMSYRKGLWFGF